MKPFELAVKIPEKMIISLFDCWKRCHSVPVDEQDVHYLQFIIQHRYRKALQGYISSGDVYKTDKIPVEAPNHLKIDYSC